MDPAEIFLWLEQTDRPFDSKRQTRLSEPQLQSSPIDSVIAGCILYCKKLTMRSILALHYFLIVTLTWRTLSKSGRARNETTPWQIQCSNFTVKVFKRSFKQPRFLLSGRLMGNWYWYVQICWIWCLFERGNCR
jgi:hypothetical protein